MLLDRASFFTCFILFMKSPRQEMELRADLIKAP